MRKTFPTIYDVADHLGLSISTVSFVINGRANKQRISASTIQRVNSYIKEIGYVPDSCARSFRTKRTGLIGLLVEDLSEQSIIHLMKALEQIAFKEGFKLIIQQLDEEWKAHAILNTLQDHQAEGYLIMLSSKISEVQLKKINNYQIPIIFFSLDSAKTNYRWTNPFFLNQVNVEKINELFIRLKKQIDQIN